MTELKEKETSFKDREPMAEIFGFFFCGKDELFNVSICTVYVVLGGKNVVFYYCYLEFILYQMLYTDVEKPKRGAMLGITF